MTYKIKYLFNIQTKLIFLESNQCPVRTFVKFMKRLNPNCPFHFQKLSIKPEDGVYYHYVVIGQNKLEHMMNEISERAGLSIRYAYYSPRATTFLTVHRSPVSIS